MAGALAAAIGCSGPTDAAPASAALESPAAAIVGPTPVPPPEPVDAFPQVATAYWVEANGQPMWAGQPDTRRPMASLTKLMTALLVVENADLEAIVTISAGTGRETGTRIGLRPGEQVRARDLFLAAMVRSANDACRALADWQGGDQAAFVETMNRRAAELGMHDTSFADACGHDAPTQYSTVRDLAKLARAALAEPEIVAAAALREHRFSTVAGRAFHVRTTNALLGRFDGATGLKTGYTPGAGRCLIAVATRGDVEIVAVLLDAPDRWWDTTTLIDIAFDEAPRPATP